MMMSQAKQARRLGRKQRGDDGDGHAGHAELVAAARRFRMRQPPQRQDEQAPGER
jgi:hypothetical protein